MSESSGQPNSDRWVVGVDGSDSAFGALGWAVQNARDRTVTIVALSAWHLSLPVSLLAFRRGLDVDRLGLSAAAAHEIDEAIRQLGPDAPPIERLAIEGQPAEALLEAAADASMLVLGQTGAGTVRHLVLGSVSRHCATHAPAPVAVVPHRWRAIATPQNVVVGFDGSDNARSALAWALEFVSSGANIRVVAAIEIAPWLDEGVTAERFSADAAAETDRMVTAIDSVDPTCRTTRDIGIGAARHALATAADGADLVVLGTRGRGGISGAILGSVTTWMLHATPCPLVVVPHRPTDRQSLWPSVDR